MPHGTAQSAPMRTAAQRAPDLVIALDADERTADAARYCVGTIARPAPAVRDRAELLTGALLAGTLASPRVRRRGTPIELRVWSRAEPTRVELAGPRELLGGAPGAGEVPTHLLDLLADRWGLEHDATRTHVWFEIDGESNESFSQRARGASPRVAQPV